MPYNFSEEEKKILKFWGDKKIFQKSLDQTKDKKPFVFYDGPPFATGLPHYGHILSSVIKDVVPRYKTMKGFYVRRRWGWDCHGMPIENLVEKEIGVSGKKDIEEKIGVAKFNALCRSKVQMYVGEWKKMVDRIARWVDFDHSYKTMDSTYMESVWWALKTLWDKGLIYAGRRVLPYCLHCETPVSKAEIAMDNSYKDITDLTITVKFKLKNEKNTYLLAWTTTPWTMPAHTFINVGPDIEYIKVKYEGNFYIVAKLALEKNFKGKKYEVIKELTAKNLVGLEYEPPFDYFKGWKNAFKVYLSEKVDPNEGTGLVHMSPAFGEQTEVDEMQKKGIEPIIHVKPDGTFTDEVRDWAGKKIKTQLESIKDNLQERGLLFSSEKYTHSYPHCWRCEKPIIYYAISAWFINIQKHKKKLIVLNEKISWYPEHLKHGRFLNIVEDAPDWNISRNRFWATPLPFFVCEKRHQECIGSVKDLKKKALNFVQVYQSDKVEEMDLHKDKMDQIRLKCSKCKKEMKRVPEVVDCWVESASMPFAELHYPFEDKKLFEERFPGQYIAEYIAQTRTWFYYMHVMGTLLFGSQAFENVVTTGTILNEKGEKLSKSKKNYPDPWLIMNQYGVDSLRFYLMASPVMSAEDLFFNEKEIRDIHNKVVNTLCNVTDFYAMYANGNVQGVLASGHVLDVWILSKLHHCIVSVSHAMDKYDTIFTCRLIKQFIEDLSLWYVRRSRDRFKEEGQEKIAAQTTLRYVLLEFSKTIAPILPFTAEFVFAKVKGPLPEESVHLCNWPSKNDKDRTDLYLEEKMEEVRSVVTLALAQRAAKAIKVRQPLAKLTIKNKKSKIRDNAELLELIKDEVNVKEVVFDDTIKEEIELDLRLTEALKEEGMVRDIVRFVQDIRKGQGLKPDDKISIEFFGSERINSVLERNKEFLAKETRSKKISINKAPGIGEGLKELGVEGEKILIKVEN